MGERDRRWLMRPRYSVANALRRVMIAEVPTVGLYQQRNARAYAI